MMPEGRNFPINFPALPHMMEVKEPDSLPLRY